MEWLPLINTVGWPGLLLFLTVRYVMPWGAARVERLLTRHLEFVDAVDKRGVEAAKNLQAVTDLLAKLAESNVALTVRQAKLTEAQITNANEVTKKLVNGGNGH